MSIRSDDPRIASVTEGFGRGQLVTYRCPECRKLLNAPLGMHGDLCPLCGSGCLYTVARITKRMLAEAERAVKS